MTAGKRIEPDADTPPVETQEQTNRGVARATGILALGNISSRILGLLREIVIANLFGISGATDALRVAILVPKNLYDLLIGGHVNGAIIPVLSEVETKYGRDELWRLVSVLISMLTAILAVLAILLEVAAPVVVRVVSGGSSAQTLELAALLLRITTPALIFMGLFAILSGTLYALRSFTWPAFGTAIFNAAIVFVALVFAPPREAVIVYDATGAAWAFARPDSGIVVVAAGWLTGSVAYVLLQLPGLRDARLRFTLDWRHPAIRRIGLLYVPVMFSLVLDTLVIRVFSYNLASRLGQGSISYMDAATTLIQFPQGLVATAISIAILPTLSRQAATIANAAPDATNAESGRAFKDTLGLGLRLATTLILPATIGLFVLATPIVALIFEHGEFTAANTAVTADVLRLYLIGLPFAALDLLLVYAFYARQDTLTPALIGLFSLTVYMGVALVLSPYIGLFSLMVADSVKHITHALISAYLMHRRLHGLTDRRFAITAGKSAVAALLMGLVAVVLLDVLTGVIGTGTLLEETALVTICGGIAGIVFLALAMLFRIEEWRWLIGLLRRRVV